ncbi:MAG TPA: T9SS type A sorting domain-containing protein, partial [Niabella sp.]|nr:T9SS type A sorting domain-containing protein [Niabella sp.]
YNDRAATTGEVQVFGNKIHSFSPVKVDSMSVYELHGIIASAATVKIWNNAIRLGIDMYGNNVDTNRTNMMAIQVGRAGIGNPLAYVEHNSIYIGGYTLYEAAGIGVAPYAQGENKIYVTNNIIQIDREIMPNVVSKHIYMYTDNFTTISAKNIWYSATDNTVPSMLKAYQQECKCDNGSFVGDPSYINPIGDSTSFDLHLASGSIANNAGITSALNIQTDIDGKKRNEYSPVDIGSYAAIPCSNGNEIIPSLSINNLMEDSLFLCPGESVTLTASVAGTFQQLQWQKDLANIGNTNDTSLITNGTGTYRLIGKTACGEFASKPIAIINTNAIQHAAVSLSANDTDICKGEEVIFTAHAVNGGDTPSYQWQVNGKNVGVNSNEFKSAQLTNGDEVSVILTSSSDCVTESTAVSNPIILLVKETPSPSVKLISPYGNNLACSASTIQFNALTNNLGSSPKYTWLLNGIEAGDNSDIYINSTLKTNDQLFVQVTSINLCNNPFTVTSDTITFDVKPTQYARATISGETTIAEGQSALLSVSYSPVGASVTYQWIEIKPQNNYNLIPGATSSTLEYKPDSSGVKIACIVANTALCVIPMIILSDTATLIVNPSAPDLSGRSAYIFPNPVMNEFVLDSLDPSMQWETLEIFSSKGEQRLAIKKIANLTSLVIPVFNLNRGLYFAILRNRSGETHTIKFIKL